jgi:hypothetical protein
MRTSIRHDMRVPRDILCVDPDGSKELSMLVKRVRTCAKQTRKVVAK